MNAGKMVETQRITWKPLLRAFLFGFAEIAGFTSWFLLWQKLMFMHPVAKQLLTLLPPIMARSAISGWIGYSRFPSLRPTVAVAIAELTGFVLGGVLLVVMSPHIWA